MFWERFGLSGDPFSGSTGEAAYIDVPSRRKARTEIAACLSEGKGIAVLTSAPGLGKTSLCRTIARDLAERFAVGHLHDASFTTRRSLLQSLLHELGRAYAGLTEHEARLQLLDAVADLSPRLAFVLIVDEAHRLSDRLLEELRSLSNHETDGIPRIRLLLCGDLSLEERLMDPALTAIAQRVLCHEVLEPLSQEESARLLDGRLMQAGGDGWEHVFTRPATELICLASDGSPRNLEQLAGRSLKTAAIRREDKVSVESVTAALQELKELPLHWNEPANLEAYAEREGDETDDLMLEMRDMESTDPPTYQTPSATAAAPFLQETRSFPAEAAVIEFGSGLTPLASAAESRSSTLADSPSSSDAAACWSDIEIDDAYAQLDRLFQSGTPVKQSISTRPPAAQPPLVSSAETAVEERLLAEIHSLTEDVRSFSRTDDPESFQAFLPMTSPTSPWNTGWDGLPEWDVVQPEWVIDTIHATDHVSESSTLGTPPELTIPPTTTPPTVASMANEESTLPLTPAAAENLPEEDEAPVAQTLSFPPRFVRDVEPLVSAAAAITEPAPGATTPEPAPQVRIDPPSPRPYARLFSRLRHLRTNTPSDRAG